MCVFPSSTHKHTREWQRCAGFALCAWARAEPSDERINRPLNGFREEPGQEDAAEAGKVGQGADHDHLKEESKGWNQEA